MKTKFQFLLTCLSALLLSFESFSQDTTYYEFETSSRPYQSLFGSVVDSMDTAISSNISFGTIPSYSIFGEQASHTFEASATGGFLVTLANDYGYTLDPFLADLAKKDSGSALIIHGASSPNDSILIIEWIHMGLSGHPAEDFVNFQLRVYRERKLIEMHYGQSNVTSNLAFRGGLDNGPAVNLARRSTDFLNAYDDTWLLGDPNNPQRALTGFRAINGVPNKDVLYRFYAEMDTNQVGLKKMDRQERWQLFPNPATDYLRIEGASSVERVEWFDSKGASVLRSGFNASSDIQVIPTPTEPGLYHLKICGLEGCETQKVLIH